MTTIMIAGATGLVGRMALQQALADDRISRVIAPTRRALAPHPKLTNPVVDFDRLPADAPWWAVDAVVCALGTTLKDAGSQAAFRKVDYDYVLAIAKHAREHGARAFALNSSLGADAASNNFYLRTKGEAEQALEACGFESLTLVRPSIIGGQRDRIRPMEYVGMQLLRALRPLVPRRYRVVPAERIAEVLIASVSGTNPGRHAIESEALQAR